MQGKDSLTLSLLVCPTNSGTLHHEVSRPSLYFIRNLLDRYGALHIWENHHHVAISIRLVGHLWLPG